MADFTKIKGVFAKDTVLRAGISDVQSYIEYPQADIYGLCADFENNTFTRLAGAVGKTDGADFSSIAPWSGMRRCVLADNGTVVAYYGEQGYVEDGTAGQVMVEIPKFYYRVVPLKLEKQTPESATDTNRLGYHLLKANYYVSSVQYEGFKLHPAFTVGGRTVDKIYISAYEGSIYDVSESAYLVNDEQIADFTADKLCSIVNVHPCSGLTQDLTRVNLNKLATNRGTGWYGLNIQTVSLIQLLCAIEYSSFNWQAALGAGVTGVTDDITKNCASLTGSTASLGNASGRASSTVDYAGTAQTAETKTSVSYRGVENFFGNIWKWIDGENIYGNGTNSGGIPYICSDYNYADSKITDNYVSSGFTVANSNDYIKYFGYGDSKYDWLFKPSRTGLGANSTNPVGDYVYKSTNLNGHRVSCFGGRWNNSTTAGGFYWDWTYAPGSYTRVVGGRLMYVPQ